MYRLTQGGYPMTDDRKEGRMAGSDKRKQSLYFPEDMLKEIQEEAARQDRSLSWIVQRAWMIARKDITKYPSVNDVEPGPDDERELQEERVRQDEGKR